MATLIVNGREGIVVDRIIQRIQDRGTLKQKTTEYLVRIAIPYPYMVRMPLPPEPPEPPEVAPKLNDYYTTVIVYWLASMQYDRFRKVIEQTVREVLNTYFEGGMWEYIKWVEHRFLLSRKVRQKLKRV